MLVETFNSTNGRSFGKTSGKGGSLLRRRLLKKERGDTGGTRILWGKFERHVLREKAGEEYLSLLPSARPCKTFHPLQERKVASEWRAKKRSYGASRKKMTVAQKKNAQTVPNLFRGTTHPGENAL